MPGMQFSLQTTSPTFLYGANQEKPELRASSVRGQLRYWGRALFGAELGNDIGALWKRESAVFGSTEIGSPVTVRVASEGDVQTARIAMLPHRSESGKRALAPALSEKTRFQLTFLVRPHIEFPADFSNALAVWLLLGGIGKRSRRTFGALQFTAPMSRVEVLKIRSRAFYKTWDSTLGDLQSYKNGLEYTFEKAFKNVSFATLKTLPKFPVLHPDHCRVILCKRPFDSAEEANRGLFALLRSPTFRPTDGVYQAAFGGVSKERRASPLHAQVRKLSGKYHLVLTAMRSQDEWERRDWEHLAKFLQAAASEFDGDTVWGNL